ncbi:hypothetical protein M404DRAFT_484250 [Pisolithus tinctorius Marx 270]|uniref:Uncharacterized protein n=1 Tax=Pisolithus tinctorius Marx 270 TaxID=870435 RepID=A0A0C3PE69_PISTI|nr:hypothetical protein M404DRAFT_484250 [Pisolithus tinctorius Marx 270]
MNVPGARQETPEPSTLSKRMPVPTTAYQERVHRKIRPSTGHSLIATDPDLVRHPNRSLHGRKNPHDTVLTTTVPLEHQCTSHCREAGWHVETSRGIGLHRNEGSRPTDCSECRPSCLECSLAEFQIPTNHTG